MENLSILAAIAALPAVIFMLVANITGSKKWIAWVGIKLPALISLIALIVMAMSYFGILKLA
jgi:hypothetical protein